VTSTARGCLSDGSVAGALARAWSSRGSALAVAGDVVKAPIHPYEILTVRVDYPNGGPKE